MDLQYCIKYCVTSLLPEHSGGRDKRIDASILDSIGLKASLGFMTLSPEQNQRQA